MSNSLDYLCKFLTENYVTIRNPAGSAGCKNYDILLSKLYSKNSSTLNWFDGKTIHSVWKILWNQCKSIIDQFDFTEFLLYGSQEKLDFLHKSFLVDISQ